MTDPFGWAAVLCAVLGIGSMATGRISPMKSTTWTYITVAICIGTGLVLEGRYAMAALAVGSLSGVLAAAAVTLHLEQRAANETERAMELRLTCQPTEMPRALQQIGAAFEVDEQSREYRNRGTRRGRLYLDVSFRSPEITPEIAAHVLAHFGEGGYPAGGFYRDLIALIARADPIRRYRLGLGEPAYVLAVSLAQSPDGVEALEAIAAEAGAEAEAETETEAEPEAEAEAET